MTTGAALLLRDQQSVATALSWQARRGLVELLELREQHEAINAAIERSLAGDLHAKTDALATLNCLAYRRPDLARPFLPAVEALAWASEGVIRLASQQILGRCGADVPPPPSLRPLAPFFSLQLSETEQADKPLWGDYPEPGEPLPDTNDPFDLTHMHHDVLRALAEETGFSFELLVRRMALLMPQLADPSVWTAAAERKLTDHNRSIGLHLGHRRPRSFVTQHALGLLIAELSDAGSMTWLPRRFENHLLIADPAANMMESAPRPEWLDVRSGAAFGGHPHKNWLDAVGEALPTVAKGPNGAVVLAELTVTVSQDHDREEESRLAVIAHRQMPFPDQRLPDIYFLGHRTRYAASEYPNLLGLDRRFPSTVIAGGSIFASSSFVALNPVVGQALGWTVSPDGLFRWADDDGNIAVESIYWTQGNIELHDVRGGPNPTASEGWLVVASADAYAAMCPFIGQYFVRHRLAGRETGATRHHPSEMRLAGGSEPKP